MKVSIRPQICCPNFKLSLVGTTSSVPDSGLCESVQWTSNKPWPKIFLPLEISRSLMGTLDIRIATRWSNKSDLRCLMDGHIKPPKHICKRHIQFHIGHPVITLAPLDSNERNGAHDSNTLAGASRKRNKISREIRFPISLSPPLWPKFVASRIHKVVEVRVDCAC